MNPEYTIILEVIAGSQMYGTSTPESDTDIRGIVVPSWRTLVHPFSNFEQHVDTVNRDLCYYSLRKFFQLAIDCNPTIVELLFVPQFSPIVNVWSNDWGIISKHKDLFLSTKCRNTFNGYAISQLKRIKLHRSWLLNPPSHQPTREEYGLPQAPVFGLEKAEVLIHSPIGCIKEEWRDYALNEKSYHDAKTHWGQYENWIATRNPKRAVLEAKSGYDTKHGMHLYRLLTEGIELLTTGNITLPRPDKDQLLEIREGKYTYDELMEMVDGFTEKLDTIGSVLPDKPNIKKLIEMYYILLPEREM